MRAFVATIFLGLTLLGCSDDSGGGDAGTAAATGTSAGSTTEQADDGASTGDPQTTAMTDDGSTTTPADTGADSSSGSPDSTGEVATGSTGVVEFAMTSPAFEEGGLFPGTMHIGGGNVHPQLDWVGAPAGTMSFGVFFHDVSIDFEHSAIWNIAADADGLPEGVEAMAMPASVPGAVQCRHWNGGFGYGGPGSQSNTYQFTLYALDTDDLSGEIDQNSSRIAVQAALAAHQIESTTLSGQSNGP